MKPTGYRRTSPGAYEAGRAAIREPADDRGNAADAKKSWSATKDPSTAAAMARGSDTSPSCAITTADHRRGLPLDPRPEHATRP